jgi:hypothetical protein
MQAKYDRLVTYPVDEVMVAISNHLHDWKIGKVEKVDKRTEFNGLQVKLGSLRLRTFNKSGICCVECGLEATHFALEKNPMDVNYHLNLWGFNEDGKEILFTHDHILARSLGGADNLSNTQTMCSVCNFAKGREEQAELLRRKEEKSKAMETA